MAAAVVALAATGPNGLGVIIENTWAIQNPELNGYTAIQGWLPSKKMAVGLAVTKGPRAAAQTGENWSELMFAELTNYLSPDHTFKAPGITPPELILRPVAAPRR